MKPEEIVTQAIEEWTPSRMICAFSGGYDSMVMTHLVHTWDLPVPLSVFSINTKLSADGWVDFVSSVAKKFGWDFELYNNQKGFEQYCDWVSKAGQPYTITGHKRAYARLKDRGFDAVLKKYKTHYQDKILFLSGIRQAESAQRSKFQSPIQRRGKSNAIFANPLFYWSIEELLSYRLEHELPENPFYETVGGSGDCQCNWGGFCSIRTLKKHSPELAAGNVAKVDKLARQFNGIGWDHRHENQGEMFEDFQDNGELAQLTSPFLCAGCSRAKTPKPAQREAEQLVLLDRMGWD